MCFMLISGDNIIIKESGFVLEMRHRLSVTTFEVGYYFSVFVLIGDLFFCSSCCNCAVFIIYKSLLPCLVAL